MGLLFYSKQTYFVATFLVFFAALSYLCWTEKNRNYGWYLLYAAIGVLIPLGLLSAWLAINGAFIPFIEQVFLNVDSKGSIASLIFKSMFLLFADKYLIAFLVCLLLTAAAAHCYRDIPLQDWVKRGLLALGLLMTVVCAASLKDSYSTSIHTFIQVRYLTGIAVLLTAFVPGLCFYALQKGKAIKPIWKDRSPYLLSGGVVAFIAAAVVFYHLNPKGLADALYESEGSFWNFCAIIYRVLNNSVLAILLYTMWRVWRLGDKSDKEWMFLLFIPIACGYAQQMACGASMVAPYYFIIALPICIAWLMSRAGRWSALRNSMLVGLCLVMVLIVGAQKTVSSYRWWGWQEGPLQAHTYSIDVEGMEGFKVTEETKKLYEECTRVVKSNTRADSTVLGYPHNVIFNQLADRPNLGRFVPIYFYDVAARKYVQEDFERIQNNPPDLVIWQDIAGCYDAHELIFNDSSERMAQYALEEWFAFAKNTDYVLAGQVQNIYIYKLKDNGIPVGYTYIESMRENSTASTQSRFYGSDTMERLTEKAITQFEGTGTVSDPFLIKGKEDLLDFAEAVNSGVLFENMYFEQTCDIDLKGIQNWEMIGAWGSGTTFMGTYNGNGHVIRNMYCVDTRKGAFAGMFGQLFGNVLNLGIEDSYFEAENVGVIAGDAIHTPMILNCYSRNIQMKASNAAGIALQFSGGRVLNCWTDNQSEDEDTYGITKQNAADNCFSFNIDPTQAGILQSISMRTSCAEKDLESVERVCAYLNEWINENHQIQCVFWETKNGEIQFRQTM